ncbi:hypothetical protein M3J09_011403 [Ascochyta lentis]
MESLKVLGAWEQEVYLEGEMVSQQGAQRADRLPDDSTHGGTSGLQAGAGLSAGWYTVPMQNMRDLNEGDAMAVSSRQQQQ